MTPPASWRFKLRPIATTALASAMLVALSGCPAPRYDVTLCQANERIGFTAVDNQSWFNKKAELHGIIFNREVTTYNEKNQPVNSRNEPLWHAESADKYQDRTHWVKGKLFVVGDVPPGWAVRRGGGPFTLTNGSLIRGETYVVEMTGDRLGKARFKFGEDVLPYCSALMNDV